MDRMKVIEKMCSINSEPVFIMVFKGVMQKNILKFVMMQPNSIMGMLR